MSRVGMKIYFITSKWDNATNLVKRAYPLSSAKRVFQIVLRLGHVEMSFAWTFFRTRSLGSTGSNSGRMHTSPALVVSGEQIGDELTRRSLQDHLKDETVRFIILHVISVHTKSSTMLHVTRLRIS